MVEDATIYASSTAHKSSKKNSVDLDGGRGPAQLKAMTDGGRGFNEVEDKNVYSSNDASIEATEFPALYSVSSGLKISLDENQRCGKNSGHSHIHVFGKECDCCAVKDIRVDEGVATRNKNDLGSQDSAELELCQLSDPTRTKTGEPVVDLSSDEVACPASAICYSDFESLLDQAEAGTNRTQGVPDVIADRSFLDELMASKNNPFLEDPAFEVSKEGEREAVRVAMARGSNPFDSEGTVNETHDGTWNGFSEDVVVAKSHNPFLDSPSFRAAVDACTEAAKVSDSDVTIEGIGDEEPGTHGEEEKSPNDSKLEAPSITSGVNCKLPQHSDIPGNAGPLQRDPMESSFASMNPYPALVSYSGQIPFSGSMSLRSESSATSNRSFAFPVLQSEWNASPAKMAKGDRRQLRNQHNRWRHTLLCCNF